MLDYKFQALWLYEIAYKFPFLYGYKNQNNETINVPAGTLLINYDPVKDTYIYQMPDGTKFQVGRQVI